MSNLKNENRNFDGKSDELVLNIEKEKQLHKNDVREIESKETGWVIFICFIVMSFPSIISTFCYTHTNEPVDLKSKDSKEIKHVYKKESSLKK